MATKKQIPVVAARMVEYQDGFGDLSNESAQWVITNPKEAVALCAKAINDRAKSAVQAAAAILGPIVSATTIPATTVKFIAKDKFVVNTGKDAKVRISYLSPDFKKEFGDKIEEAFAGSIIHGRDLRRNSIDGPIINELGGKEKAETTLAEIYSMMEHDAGGMTNGPLINSHTNIFYVKNINGILRAVSVYWRVEGWIVSVVSVEDPHEWSAGSQVFSRNFLESLAA